MVDKFLKSVPGIVFFVVISVLISSFYLFFYENLLNSGWNLALSFTIIIAAAAGMLVLPILFIRHVFKKPLSVFGFCLPVTKKKALLFSVLTAVFFLPVLFYFSKLESFRTYYLLGENGTGFIGPLLAIIIFPALYYFFEEFLFRGFLLWSLWPKLRYNSFWVIGIIFSFFHLSKPPIEILFAFFLSLALCFLSLRFKSFMPAALAHFLIALALNLLINFSQIFYLK